MERDTNERGRDATPDEQLGDDDQEFSSVEDVGSAPAESPSIDDV